MSESVTRYRLSSVEPLEDRTTPAAALAVSGNADGAGSPLLFFPDTAGHYASTPAATVSAFTLDNLKTPTVGGFNVATVRSAVGDVNGDGTPDIVTVTGPGPTVRVAVIDGADARTPLAAFAPFGDFTGGGFVAVADFDHDGRAEFVVTPDEGGGPRTSVYSLRPNGVRMTADFFGIDDADFRGGARPAVGDVNGDGTADLIVAAGYGGGPRVAVFDGATVGSKPTRLVNDFFAFEPTLRNGAYVAVGDRNGDGAGDLIFGGGPGGSPRVLVIDGRKLLMAGPAATIANPLSNFFVAGDDLDRGGVRVTVKDADGDNLADVVAASGDGFRVRVYLGNQSNGVGEPKVFQDLTPFGVPTDEEPVYLPDGIFVG